MNNSRNMKLTIQDGFTIVEMMIATMVFSTILLIVTVGVIHFSHDYYEGINASTTQNIARSITDNLTQSIQFSGTTPQPDTTTETPAHYFCAGSEEYMFKLGQQQTDASYALVRFPVNPGSCYDDADTSSDSVEQAAWNQREELLQPRMRLTQFVATPGDGGIWQLSIGIALGDDDQFCAPTARVNSCDNGAPDFTATDYADQSVLDDLHCKLHAGSQFCYVAALNTQVQSRLQGVE